MDLRSSAVVSNQPCGGFGHVVRAGTHAKDTSNNALHAPRLHSVDVRAVLSRLDWMGWTHG